MSNILGTTTINNISLSGETDLFIDNLESNTFMNTPSTYYSGLTGNIQSQLNSLSSSISGVTGAILSGNNIWAGNNQYNVNLPTSTLTPTLNTQLTTKAYNDGAFVTKSTSETLTGSKTWTAITQFTSYLIPRHSTTNSLRLGANALQYQNTSTVTDAYNVAYGANSLQGSSTTPSLNFIKRCIAIGDSAGQKLTDQGIDLDSNDNVLIGHRVCQNATYNTTKNIMIGCAGANVGICRGEFYKNNVMIGFGISSSLSSQNNVSDCCIVGGSSSIFLNNIGKATIIGANNNLTKNSFTVCGSDNLTSASAGNRICILGSGNLTNNSAEAFSCCVGNQNLVTQTNEFYNCVVGFNNNINYASNITGVSMIGVNMNVFKSDVFYIGSNHNLRTSGKNKYQDLLIANKNMVLCNIEISLDDQDIHWEDPETINITSSSVIDLWLPTPNADTTTDGRYNIGTRFTIIKSYYPLTAININCPTGGTYNIILPDGTTSTTYTSPSNENSFTIVCIANSGSIFQVINNNYPQITNYVDTINNQTIGGIKTFSSPPVMSGASITSNTIPTSAINNTSFVDLTNNQTIQGIKTFSSTSTNSSLVISNSSTTTKMTSLNTAPISTTSNIWENRVFGLNDFGTSTEYSLDCVYTPVNTFGTERGRRDIYTKNFGNFERQISFNGNCVDCGQVLMATQGFTKQAVRASLTGNTNFNSSLYYGATINVVSSTGNYILNIPSALGAGGYISGYGQEFSVNNNTSSSLTLTSASGSFSGNYGTGTTTWILAPYQQVELYSDGTNWNIQRISGNPMAYIQTKNANQSIANITSTSVPFQTNSNISWNNTTTQLTYGLVGSDYRFTNNTGYGMTISITANVGWATNSTGIRMVQVLHSNTTRYGQSPIISQVPGNATIGTTNFITGILYLAPTEYFSISAWQNSGGALNITTASPNTNITITRI